MTARSQTDCGFAAEDAFEGMPDCLRLRGIVPIGCATSAASEHALQRMQALMLLERDAARGAGLLPPPWEGLTASAARTIESAVLRLTPKAAAANGWIHGAALWKAVCAYFADLRWAACPGIVSEVAVDFELHTSARLLDAVIVGPGRRRPLLHVKSSRMVALMDGVAAVAAAVKAPAPFPGWAHLQGHDHRWAANGALAWVGALRARASVQGFASRPLFRHPDTAGLLRTLLPRAVADRRAGRRFGETTFAGRADDEAAAAMPPRQPLGGSDYTPPYRVGPGEPYAVSSGSSCASLGMTKCLSCEGNSKISLAQCCATHHATEEQRRAVPRVVCPTQCPPLPTLQQRHAFPAGRCESTTRSQSRSKRHKMLGCPPAVHSTSRCKSEHARVSRRCRSRYDIASAPAQTAPLPAPTMSVTATGPDGASCAVPADGTVTVGALLALVRDELGLPLSADAYEVIATSGGGAESALHLEPEDAELEGYGIVGAGEAVDVRVTGKEAARGTLARREMTEENAVERLAEVLRGGGYAETVDLVVTADWAGRATVVEDEEGEDEDVELDLLTLAVRVSEVGELDLSECAALGTLGNKFLAYCGALTCVRLPPSVEEIGSEFLYASGITALDLSHVTGLKSLGEDFLSDTKELRSLELPSSVEDVGSYFLRGSGITALDLSHVTGLKSLGAGFLSDTKELRSLELPSSVEDVGFNFLYASGITALDLSHVTGLKSLGACFLSDTEELSSLKLPSSVEDVGSWFLRGSGITDLDLSHVTGLKSLGEDFLSYTKELRSLELPSSVEDVGFNFLCGSGITDLDLSHVTGLKSLGDDFLSDTKELRSLELPSSVEDVGSDFLLGSKFKLSREEVLASHREPARKRRKDAE